MLRAVRSNRRLVSLLLSCAWAGVFVSSCGGSSEGILSATGGELCAPDRKICIEVPPQAVSEQQRFRIAFPSADRPGGQLTEVWDIEALNQESYRFLKPAIIRIKFDAIDRTSVPDEQLLRVFSSRDGNWEVLGDLFYDKVRSEIRGSTLLLSTSSIKRAVSAFAVMRVDRLPDGGIPMETDAGPRPDGGTIFIPPIVDAGPPDAGRPDAGRPDAGRPDAGVPDAGVPDAGVPDAGRPDAGVPDSGMMVDAGFDAGVVIDAGFDAGVPDAGVDAGVDAGGAAGVDAGVDAGAPDAGVDAGAPDAGTDAGDPDAGAPDAGDGG
jgi:hypothetical protein